MVGENGMKELGGAADKGVGNGWGEGKLKEARCFSPNRPIVKMVPG